MVKKVVSRTTYVDQSKIGITSPTGEERVYVGTVDAEWMCGSCQHGPIMGNVKKCPSCGHSKDETETYQPPAAGLAAPYLTPAELAERGVDITHSPDAVCPFCDARLKPNAQVCPNCGGQIVPKEEAPKQSFSSYKPMYNLPTSLPTNLSWQNVAMAVGGIFLFLVVIGGLVNHFRPRNVEAEVTSANWTSTIYVQEYQYNQHSGWQIPVGGNYVSQRQEVHHTVQVLDRTEEQCHDEEKQNGYDTVEYDDKVCTKVYSHTDRVCYDDGTCDTEDVYETQCNMEKKEQTVPHFDSVEVCVDVDIYRDEPVYQPWYTYKIWEWVNISPVVSTGSGFEPQWPNFVADDKHRETDRVQTYEVKFSSQDDEFTFKPETFEDYRQYQIGTHWIVRHSGGLILEIKPGESESE